MPHWSTAVMLLLLFSTTAARAAEMGYVLRQNHFFMGPTTVYVSKRALRIEGKNIDFTLLSRAPNWNVSLYNTKRNVVFTMPLERYLRSGIHSIDVLDISSQRFTLSRSRTARCPVEYAGVKAIRVRSSSRELVYTDVVATSPEAQSILQRFFNTPQARGVPLKFYRHEGRSDKRGVYRYITGSIPGTKLTTASIKKSELEGMVLPPNLKKVKSDREVVISDDKTKFLEEFIR